jgi:hypothetical protein
MTDVPTLTSATVANYCVMSPIASSPLISLTNGNLTAGGTDEASLIGTIGVNSGKWYWEVTVTSGSVTPYLGVSSNSFDKSGVGSNYVLAGISWYGNGLKKAYTGTSSTSATSNTTGVYGFALDISAGTLAYYFNNSLVFTDTTIPTSGVTLFPLNVHTNSGSNSWNPANFNFGQQPFTYTAPANHLALNTFNLPTPTIGATASTTANKYFDATTYTGNGTSGRVLGNAGGFQADLVWIKGRTVAWNHQLADIIRGGGKSLQSNLTDAEVTNEQYGYVSAFSSSGFTLTTGSLGADLVNNNTSPYVAWQWRANGTGSTNTDGSITSTVSANTSAGFSIVTYTGNGTASTVGHGLGVTPAFIIVKCRNAGFATNWVVWSNQFASLTNNFLVLNNTSSTGTLSNYWGVAAPTSSVFGVANGAYDNNHSGLNLVAYCFAQIAGYSAFGSYTGNGSTDGTFIFTGFRPRYLMIKSTSVESWELFDTSRSPYNQAVELLEANSSGAENTSSTSAIDILSNGFKQRNTRAATNGSGTTYIYMAFAENPFKYANAR